MIGSIDLVNPSALLLTFTTAAFAVLVAFHSLNTNVNENTRSREKLKQKAKRLRRRVRKLRRTCDSIPRIKERLDRHDKELMIVNRHIEARNHDNASPMINGRPRVCRVSTKKQDQRLMQPRPNQQERALILDVYYGIAVSIGGKSGNDIAFKVVRALLSRAQA